MDTKQPKVGDIFTNKTEKYRIIEINRPLGYNEYMCQSMETGVIQTFFFHQIILGMDATPSPLPCPENDVDLMDFCDPDDNIDELLAAIDEQIEKTDAENKSLPMNSTSMNFEPKQELVASRFANVDENYLCDLEGKRNEATTNNQTKWAVNLFRSWLISRNLNVDFEMADCDTLNMYLRQFYAEVRTQKGEKYSKNAIVGIRAGINRYLTSPPYSRKINIMKDKEFMTSNHALLGMVKEMKRDGLDKTQHKQAIPQADVQKCYSSGALSDDNPTSLQLKVWFELSLHLGRRGREGLSHLQKNAFEVKVDESGNSYVQMCYNEADKTHHGIDSKENIKNPRMYATCLSNCPVQSFQLYVAKLNPKCDRFFQRPKTRFKHEDEAWYDNVPVGKNKLATFMKVISEKAGLNTVYTNHCIRATLVTKLHHAGVSAHGIMSISGHRNEKSLQSYVQAPSSAQRKEYSNILASVESEHNVCVQKDVDVESKTVTRTNKLDSLFQNANINAGGNVNIAINLHKD